VASVGLGELVAVVGGGEIDAVGVCVGEPVAEVGVRVPVDVGVAEFGGDAVGECVGEPEGEIGVCVGVTEGVRVRVAAVEVGVAVGFPGRSKRSTWMTSAAVCRASPFASAPAQLLSSKSATMTAGTSASLTKPSQFASPGAIPCAASGRHRASRATIVVRAVRPMLGSLVGIRTSAGHASRLPAEETLKQFSDMRKLEVAVVRRRTTTARFP
jgi:hypothetical protein